MKDFRYVCEWEEFILATDTLHKMIDEKKAFLLFGVESFINLKLCTDEKLEQSLQAIIQDEVLFLLRDAIDSNGRFDSDELKEILQEDFAEKNEENINNMITAVKNKFNYVYEVLVDSNIMNRYLFKKETVLNKISKIKYNFSDYILDDGSMQKHSIIQLGVNKDIDSLVNNTITKTLGKNGDEVISFACDSQDLDYFIFLLNKIKKEMEEL